MKSINIGWKASILDEKHRYWMKRNTFYQNTNLYSNIGWKEHILSKYTFVHLQHWMKGNTFLSKYTIACLQYCIKRNIFYQNTYLYPTNIGWKASILDEKKHILSKYTFVHPILDEKKHILSKYTFVLKRNTFLSILDERKYILSKYTFFVSHQYWMEHILSKYTFVSHQYWMKSINIGWKETHFIKIQICTPWILHEKNTFYQNIHLYTFNIGWNTFYENTLLDPINIGWKPSILDEKKHILSKYKFVLQYWKKRTHFIKIYICTPSTLDERKHILSKYTFVSHQYWMKSINIGWKETHFIKIQICTPWILHEKNTFYQNIHLYTINIGWNETHFIKIHFCILSILDEKHQYWMKSINIGWKAWYWMKRNTFYQNISLYTFNIGWKETHFIKIHFCIPSILDEKHQYWMKSINIGWKASILDEEKHILSKYKFVLQYWMKRTHFIKIYICSPSTLDETKHIFIKIHLCAFNIGWNETFYQNTLLYTSILDEKHQYWMKRNTFYQNIICTPSTLDERKHILSKYTFVSHQYWMKRKQYWMKSINIEKHRYWMKRNTFYQNTNLYSNIGWKEHILSKYTFVHLQHWMKGNTFLSKYTICLQYCINILSKYTILDEKHQYWMKSINIGWKETHFIKIHICTPILDEKNTFYQNIHLYTFNIGWKETHFIKIHNCMPSILHQKKHILSKYHQYWMKSINIGWKETHFIKIQICTHILSKYIVLHQYWMKRTHFIKIYICTPYQHWMKSKHILSKYTFLCTQSLPSILDEMNTFYQNTLLYPINIGWKASILDEKKHILLKYKFVHLEYCMKRTHFIKIYICTPSTLDEHILSKYTFVSHQYWMKTINIGWKETHFIKIQICTQYWMKRTHFIKIYICTPSTLDERKHILSKYTFVSHQYWMKSINIGWKETHFIKIQICTPWILHEKNTFYQNIHLYTINIGWNETHFIKIHFCILSILDEKHKYWMASILKSIDIGWKETHFIKI